MKPFFRNLLVVVAVLALTMTTFGAAAGTESLKDNAEKVFKVYPTGDDDTDNILNAFAQANAAGPGSTVLLAEGNFKVRMIEIWDFDGYFKGSGEGVTVIDTFADQECQCLIDNNRWPALLSFFRGYLRISDLTIHITTANPCQPYKIHLYGPDSSPFTTIFALLNTGSPFDPAADGMVQQIEPGSGLVERITIQGEGGLLAGIWMGGLWTTKYLWETDCLFHGKWTQGEYRVHQTTLRNAVWGFTLDNVFNSHVTAGGSESQANYFDEVEIGIWANDSSGSYFEISFNHMDHVTLRGIETHQGAYGPTPYLESASEFNYHHNDISVYGSGVGISLWDWDNLGVGYPRLGKRLITEVHQNRITLNSESAWGVRAEWVDQAVINRNTIEGYGEWAMVFGQEGPTIKGKIMNNDLQNFTATNEPYKILLGSGTEKYLVNGKKQGVILDQGTDNKIITLK